MNAGGFYTRADCWPISPGATVAGKVIVLRPCHLPEQEWHGLGQLAVCLEQAASGETAGQILLTVSLESGEYGRWIFDAVLGALRPDRLPEEAKLQLSQVRPGGLFSQRQAAPAFTGYCFLPDGRFTAGVGLRDEQEAAAYVMLQRAYQYRVLICDHESLAVLEMAEGQMHYAASGLREALAAVLFGRASPWHERNERQ